MSYKNTMKIYSALLWLVIFREVGEQQVYIPRSGGSHRHPGGDVSVAMDCYQYGEEIVVEFMNKNPQRKDDWLGVYHEPFGLSRLPWPEVW
jgi:hypothetical protein